MEKTVLIKIPAHMDICFPCKCVLGLKKTKKLKNCESYVLLCKLINSGT